MDRGMQYRPEYCLDRLRMMMRDDSSSNNGEQDGEQLLPVRWLRTIVVDLSHTAERDVGERLPLQRRSAVGCAVERVVCKGLSKEHLPQLLPLVTECVALLTSLDLRGCAASDVGDDFLLAIADAHGLSLRRLYLPLDCMVAQSTLDRFTQLEELDASAFQNLTNVDFCGATLRVLYANWCSNLTDAGLRRATRLEVLHVSSCRQVTDVSSFAHCLLELDASWCCGIGSGALSDCRRLQVLNADRNKITTLRPFAQRLRELNAGGPSSALDLAFSALKDAALANARGLVSLSAWDNPAITTVEPFGASLRRLEAYRSTIGDAGLVTATNLVYLDASDNGKICSLAPFCASLLELRACGRSLSESALSAATNLIWFDVRYNKLITTVQSCGRSLRHLVACCEWSLGRALTDEGLSTATQLVTLNCRWNPNVTTIEPFLQSVEELTTGSGVYLHFISGEVVERCVAELERDGFALARSSITSSITIMHRNTVTYELCDL